MAGELRMRIAICDDESVDRKNIADALTAYARQNQLEFEIDEFEDGTAFLAAFHRASYLVVFLDVYMGETGGVETARAVCSMDENCAIIFVTSSPDFRAEGFEVAAVHYLIKPIGYAEIQTAMNRCKHRFNLDDRFFFVLSDRRRIRIHFKDVIYIEVYGKVTLAHTTGAVIKSRTPLAEIKKLLESGPFLQCHRCYIVNMMMIRKVLEDGFLMKNTDNVPIRKNGRQEIKDAYSDYLFHSVRGDADE